MSPWRLLWRALNGEDAKVLRDHTATLAAHERRIDALERRADAREAIRRIVGEDR